MRSKGTVAAILLGAACFLTVAPTGAGDVVIYGDHAPVRFRDGTSFQSPFDLQWSAGDPLTELRFESVPGLRNPLGAYQWGHTAFGKYVLSGTFGKCVFPAAAGYVEDLLVNIFDSEEKDACTLDVTGPAAAASKTTRTLVTANPAGRQSRIFMGGQGYVGFILADLDNPDPCSWPTVQIAASDPDGLAVLWHEDDPGTPFGRDYVVVPSWWGGSQTVFRVDSAGVQTVNTYVLPMLARPGQCVSPPDRPCFEITGCATICPIPDQCWVRGWPVQLPQVDRRYGKSDVRWTSSLELYMSKIPPASGSCGGFVAAQEYWIDLTAVAPVIAPTSPVFHAGAVGEDADAGVMVHADPQPIGLSYDSQGGLWKSLWRRKTVPTGDDHPYFYPTVDGVFAVKTAGQRCVVNQQPLTVGTSGAPPAGEHCYFDPTRVNDMTRVDVDQLIRFDHDISFGNLPNVQVANAMYIAGPQSIQRAILAWGTWWLVPPDAYKVALPFEMLPMEPRYCSDGSDYCECPAGTPTNQSCEDTGHCGAGVTCVPRPETDYFDAGRKVLVAGGAPVSLWTPAHFAVTATAPVPWPRNNLYWYRIPIVSELSDGVSAVRPGLAWSGDRLWMVAEHGGVLKYRVRADGLWSTWYALPTNVATAGGAAVLSGGGWVEVFARATSNGQIYTTKTTSVTCAPGSCVWEPWQLLPGSGSLATAYEPAAAYQGTANPIVVMRDSSRRKLYYTRRFFGRWNSSWTRIDGPDADSAPSVAWNANTSTFWLAIAKADDKTIKVTRNALRTSPVWENAGSSGDQAPWLTAPAISFEPGPPVSVRVLAAANSQYVYQAVHNGTGWGPWTRLVSQAMSNRQPATAVVNGDVNLVTNWLNYMQETLVK